MSSIYPIGEAWDLFYTLASNETYRFPEKTFCDFFVKLNIERRKRFKRNLDLIQQRQRTYFSDYLKNRHNGELADIVSLYCVMGFKESHENSYDGVVSMAMAGCDEFKRQLEEDEALKLRLAAA